MTGVLPKLLSLFNNPSSFLYFSVSGVLRASGKGIILCMPR